MADLVDPAVLYRIENNLLETKLVRNSWSSTMLSLFVALVLVLMLVGFLAAQYNNTLKLKSEETSRKNIPYSQMLWNNAVRNVVS